MFDRKAYHAKWAKANPERVKAISAKWYKAHQEKANAASAKYQKTNLARFRKQYKDNPEKAKTKAAKWKNKNLEKAKADIARWKRTDAGKESQRKSAAERKKFGFTPLNKHFEGSAGHHIDKERVIYIPAELHKSIPHSVSLNKNMEKINSLAFDYLSTD